MFSPSTPFLAVTATILAGSALSFKTGLEDGLICNVCVGTHPGCGETGFDYRWYWGKMCPRYNDKCVKLIERKGADVMVTRDCLSNLEAFRTDIPADKYEGCRPASKDVKLGQYVFNKIDELDVYRNHYENTTYCFCDFDHWCNAAPTSLSGVWSLVAFAIFLVLQLQH